MLVGSFIASIGLVGAPLGTALAGAGSRARKTTAPLAQGSRLATPLAPVTADAPAAQPMPTQPPQTLDEYVVWVHDRLQHEAARSQQPGTAALQLTIGKDGSVRRTEIVRLEGPASLREEMMTVVRQIGTFPPLPSDTNADVLVVSTVVAFGYPSADLLDPFGQGRRGR